LTQGKVKIEVKPTSANGIDAAATGASEGMKLALNVAAMLIAFLGLLALLNGILAWFGGLWGFQNLSLEGIFSYLFAPVAWLMGVPLSDCLQVGILLGKKTILNEFIAYVDLKGLIENGVKVAQGQIPGDFVPTISERAIIISTYALCGFSNIGS
ncbi:nucleoside transporter C-terminal domain-containing protein, partial [Planktothrix sp.]|uniref:nucleoside transporter C-terminal domain-containing protein n=1 Tax=Planktothrix sp. TaxID=3088171 RepID=UPI0038D3D9BA